MATKKNIRYRVQQFSEATLSSTESAWSELAGEEAFSTECRPVFEWAAGRIDYASMASGDSKVYGLFSDSDEAAEALIEVVSTQRGAKPGTTKLLKVIVSPSYWNNGKRRNRIVGVFGAAISGTIRLSKAVQGGTVKLYGRSDELLNLLQSVCAYLQAGSFGVRCEMKGRWLEIVT